MKKYPRARDQEKFNELKWLLKRGESIREIARFLDLPKSTAARWAQVVRLQWTDGEKAEIQAFVAKGQTAVSPAEVADNPDWEVEELKRRLHELANQLEQHAMLLRQQARQLTQQALLLRQEI